MARLNEVPFVKGHGTGNDFVIIPDLEGRLDLTDEQVRWVCDRHRGIGANGVLRVVRTDRMPEFADFAPVAQVCENAFAFAISGKIPATTMAEWVAWCRQNPDKASFGSPGQGSSPHFMGVTLARALGLTMNHIPYRGNNFALTDSAGGHISGMVSTTGQLLAPHRGGQMRILGVTSPKRLAELPEVPTFAELGVPALTLTEGTWVMASSKTPPAVVNRLSEAIVESLKDAAAVQALKVQADIAPLGSRALAARLRKDYDERGAGIKAAGFTAGQG